MLYMNNRFMSSFQLENAKNKNHKQLFVTCGFWYAGRSRHSVSNSPPDCSPENLRFQLNFRTLAFESLQPKYNKNTRAVYTALVFLVRRKGFEPPTFWFVAKHSIQLSYRRLSARLVLLLKYYTTLQIKLQVFFE